MLFNTSRTYDFMPEISIDGVHNLEVVEEMKLLGVIFQSNMNVDRWTHGLGLGLFRTSEII